MVGAEPHPLNHDKHQAGTAPSHTLPTAQHSYGGAAILAHRRSGHPRAFAIASVTDASAGRSAELGLSFRRQGKELDMPA